MRSCGSQIRMANASAVLSRGNTWPLSCHGPSKRLPRLSCMCGMAATSQESSAPHGEQPTESACLRGEGTRFPKPRNSSPEGRRVGEGSTESPGHARACRLEAHLRSRALRAQEGGSSLPKDFSWARLQVRSALGEEPRVSALASTCLGCSEKSHASDI